MALKSSEARAQKRNKTKSVIIFKSRGHTGVIISVNPFRLSFSEPKCARGGHIIFLESIFQHSLHEIVIYSINRKSYNKKLTFYES